MALASPGEARCFMLPEFLDGSLLLLVTVGDWRSLSLCSREVVPVYRGCETGGFHEQPLCLGHEEPEDPIKFDFKFVSCFSLSGFSFPQTIYGPLCVTSRARVCVCGGEYLHIRLVST